MFKNANITISRLHFDSLLAAVHVLNEFKLRCPLIALVLFI